MWLSEEALHIAKERKKQGEREKYTYLSAEFQRIEKKRNEDLMFLLSEQCK